MPIYTVVDESCDVMVYRTLKAVSEGRADSRLYVVTDEDEFDEDAPLVVATAAAIRRAIRKHGEVRLSDERGRDWRYKIAKHD